jgi:hypothetical protein
MSHELDALLRASMETPTPQWLDRLVIERVVTLVENEPSLPTISPTQASNGANVVAIIVSTIALFRKIWSRDDRVAAPANQREQRPVPVGVNKHPQEAPTS